MLIKNSVYGNKSGLLDPTVLKRTKQKELISDEQAKKNLTIKNIDLYNLRMGMGSRNLDISQKKVKVCNCLIPCHQRYIPARFYYPSQRNSFENCLVYIHGGGFFGGSLDTLDNQCKLISERARCVVISIGYRLAPETFFPGQYADVKESIDWIRKNKDKLGFTSSKIFLAGDSAGANLAIAYGLRDKHQFIKKIISIYGALDLTETSQTIYHWSYNDYFIMPEHLKYIHSRLNKFILLSKVVNLLYIGNNIYNNPLISPVYASDFNNLSPVILIESEFDYFLQSNKYFSKKLISKGKEVHTILYKGLDHGFFDRLGYLKQAEDVVDQIALIVNNNRVW